MIEETFSVDRHSWEDGYVVRNGDGFPLTSDGKYIGGEHYLYTTKELALAAKARFEARAAHPNMPDEWCERNQPGGEAWMQRRWLEAALDNPAEWHLVVYASIRDGEEFARILKDMPGQIAHVGDLIDYAHNGRRLCLAWEQSVLVGKIRGMLFDEITYTACVCSEAREMAETTRRKPDPGKPKGAERLMFKCRCGAEIDRLVSITKDPNDAAILVSLMVHGERVEQSIPECELARTQGVFMVELQCARPAPFTPPDHVMFRGERLEHTLYDAAQASEAFHSYTSPNNNGTTVWFSDEYMRGAHNGRMVLDENWHETSLADGFARLQAWLEQDAREWAAAQVFQSEEIDQKPSGVVWQAECDESGCSRRPCAAVPEIGQFCSDHCRAAQKRLAEMRESEKPEACSDCGRAFNKYRPKVWEHYSGSQARCGDCMEKTRERFCGPGERRRMAYDEPPRAPISATAKWHCLHTSVDATPGWEE